MARRAKEFEERNVKLLGLSVDSVYSHLAWFDSIKETFGVDVTFPVIADIDLKVARLYGMVGADSGTGPVRSVFFVDPELTIRATLTYPAPIGRNIDELLRVFDAFQENVQSNGCAIPADWTPGKPTLSPAPMTLEALNKRWQENGQAGYKAWYYKVNEP